MSMGYHHITKCQYSPAYKSTMGSQGFLFGCNCEESCDDEEVCICLAQHGCAYDKNNRLKSFNPSGLVYECNSMCACEDQPCGNRVVQQTPPWDLVSFCTQGKGDGLKTNTFIPKGSFVIEYIGEVITTDEARERCSDQESVESSYILTLQEHFGSQTLKHHIDARHVGNEARFINHSCAPNLFLLPVRVDSPTPRLTFFSLRDIAVGEELSFDYGHDAATTTTGESLSSCERLYDGSRCKVVCLCGQNACRGFLPYDEQLFT